jgi:EAL domain-containing protein (putative c-di-GMP-specific phosphodiesterase class I)
VVAEGVEDELQLKTLRQLHCDEIQGYYYAKPMTAEKVNHFLDQKGDYLLDRGSLVTRGNEIYGVK